jgi:hypothetical protein
MRIKKGISSIKKVKKKHFSHFNMSILKNI